LERIIAKLEGFLGDPDQMLAKYYRDDVASKYARSIAYYKKGKKDLAVKTIDELIKSDPKDGYFYEQKGQILFEGGNIKDAIIAYNQAIELNKSNDLARISLAQAIIALDSGDKKITQVAIDNLLIAQQKNQSDAGIYKQLSIAYSQNGDLGRSYLALAELNLLEENKEKIKKYVKLAKENLDKSDKIDLLRVDDIEEYSKKIKKDKKDEEQPGSN
jgi:predicted Zn-dependent protease